MSAPHDIKLLACTSSYPSPDSSLNLSCISYYSDKYPDVDVGYSDHSAGVNASYVSILKGAQVIELHFTDNTRTSGPDQLISKVVDDFSKIRSFFNFAHTANGTHQKVLQTAEYFTWKTQRKSLYACRDISRGRNYL